MKDICARRECTGCAACVNACPKQCIAMLPDHEGFQTPRIDSSACTDCGLCRRVCAKVHSPTFGPAPKSALAVWAKDKDIRQSSSSGGVYKTVAGLILSAGGFVNAVRFDKDFYLRHWLLAKVGELDAVRGSKYVQSIPGRIYREVKQKLESGHKVLFTSSPCQVAGLLAYLQKDYPNLFTCDFVCHGVPSPEELRRDVKMKSDKLSQGAPSDYIFRDLKNWGYASRLEIGTRSFQYDIRLDDYYTRFLSGVNNRESCFHCTFARPRRVSDVTIADFWGVGRYSVFPSRFSGGCSLVLINTAKGRKLLKACSDLLHIEGYPIWACADNTNLFRPSERPTLRDRGCSEAQAFDGKPSMCAPTLVERFFRRAFGIIAVSFWRTTNFLRGSEVIE